MFNRTPIFLSDINYVENCPQIPDERYVDLSGHITNHTIDFQVDYNGLPCRIELERTTHRHHLNGIIRNTNLKAYKHLRLEILNTLMRAYKNLWLLKRCAEYKPLFFLPSVELNTWLYGRRKADRTGPRCFETNEDFFDTVNSITGKYLSYVHGLAKAFFPNEFDLINDIVGGVEFELEQFPGDVTQEEILSVFQKQVIESRAALNFDGSITAIEKRFWQITGYSDYNTLSMAKGYNPQTDHWRNVYHENVHRHDDLEYIYS